MSDKKWYIILGVSLVVISAGVYSLQNLLFHKPDDTFFYLFQDLAFVPVQVLLVMIILDRLLQRKEREFLMHKLNMIVGVFFNEAGTGLIEHLAVLDRRAGELSAGMRLSDRWDEKARDGALEAVRRHGFDFAPGPAELSSLRDFLVARREGMLRLLENPNLLEHEAFTDLLWAVFHLTDELEHRADFTDMPETDRKHLAGDAVRAARLLYVQWIGYMWHLKRHYPYLFSLAVRMNPFDPDRGVTVRT